MRPLSLLVLLVTGLALRGHSQVNFNSDYFSNSEIACSWMIESGTDLIFAARKMDAGYTTGALYRIDQNGQQVNRKVTSLQYIKAFKTADNNIAAFGYHEGCDVRFNTFSFDKFDANGNVLFSNPAVVTSTPQAFTQLPNGSYFIFTSSLLFAFNAQGAMSFSLNTGLSGGNVLVSAVMNNSPSLVVFSSAGNTVTATPAPLFTQMQFYNNQQLLCVGTDGNIYKLSPAFATISFSNPGNWPVKQIAFANNMIHALRSSGPGMSAYSVCDTSFTILHTSTTSTSSFNQRAIAITSAGKAAILSDHAMSPTSMYVPHWGIALNVQSTLTGNNFRNNAVLRSVTVDTVYGHRYPNNQAELTVDATVKIVNEGPDFLSTVRLNALAYYSWHCDHQFFSKTYSVNLNAGDSIAVSTGTFNLYTSMAGVEFDYSVCLYVSSPNGETDKVLEDNQQCNVYHVTNVVGLAEPASVALKIQPNPSSGFFMVTLPQNSQGLKVRNTLGELMLQAPPANGEIVMDLSHLDPGFYYVTVETSTGRMTAKIIRE
jgi:hypothetical protein